MKNRSIVIGLALIAPFAVAWAAKPIDPNKLPKVDCSELHFSKAFLDKYPKAPQACIEAREYKGMRYAKFTAKVYLNSSDRTTVTLLNAAGDSVTTFSIKPKPGATVNINGKKVKFSDLAPGEEMSFWVAETRLVAWSLPEPSAEGWTVVPPAQ
jgi:hypothetical protein